MVDSVLVTTWQAGPGATRIKKPRGMPRRAQIASFNFVNNPGMSDSSSAGRVHT
jgi:hypothetical protein